MSYIEIDKEFFINNIQPEFETDSEINIQGRSKLRYGASMLELNPNSLEWDDLEKIYDIAQNKGNRSIMMQVSAIKNLISDFEGAKIANLRALAIALPSYFSDNLIDGWIYSLDRKNNPITVDPYLITDIRYYPPKKDEPATVSMRLVANSPRQSSRDKRYTRSIYFDSSDIRGKTIPQILAKENLFHETEELKNIYLEQLELFNKYQPQKTKQFLISGKSYETSGGSYSSDYYFNSNGYIDIVTKNRFINDEGIVKRVFNEEHDPYYWRNEAGVEEKFDRIPQHCYIFGFNLDTHKYTWVHATNMKPYEYDTGLRDKLILPQRHKDLIDILVSDLDILKEDIIEGKSGGTTILATGKPGLGKTLSAEIYSEAIEKPLYKVHSGQLGLNSKDVQENLEVILKRASRWEAIVLLDEADVFIRERGNDLQQNAVVASFLRTLEYFDGILFMTTNREFDVDDAIKSRCIAVIRYETPSEEDAKKIWKVLSTQLEVNLSDELIDQLVLKFPEASGRDIKELLKLTSRFAKGKNEEISLELFRQCAQFRAIKIK